MLVGKPGRNAEPTAARRELLVELQRLRRAGLPDLALRPGRYPQLLRALHATTSTVPRDMIGRLHLHATLFDALISQLPSQQLRDAAHIMFHTRSGATPPPLDERRRAADRAYTGRGYAREPDTVQRYLERDLLDPLLLELLSNAPRSPAEREPVSSGVDHDTWEDDLQRVAICVARQDFRLGTALLERWLGRIDRQGLDDTGAHLYGRSLVLLGDVRRDQGQLRGPLSAEAAYRGARDVFAGLHLPRRTAQTELLLAVTTEMCGELVPAAERYRTLADDKRLSDLDRARSQLWVGTSLTKLGHLAAAATSIADATRRLETLDEPLEWAVAHQKQALAQLAAGQLEAANQHIELATEGARDESPLQQVRLQVAHAHILLSDRATIDTGRSLLNQVEYTASRYSLAHQQRAIDRIRRLNGAATSAEWRPRNG